LKKKKKKKNKNVENLVKKKEKYLKIIDNYDDYIIEEFEKINNNFNSLERKRIKLFPKIDVKISTKEYFNILVKLIDSVEKCEFLEVLIEIIKPIIKYNRNLIKKIENYDTISAYKNSSKKLKRKQTKTKKNNKKKNKKQKRYC